MMIVVRNRIAVHSSSIIGVGIQPYDDKEDKSRAIVSLVLQGAHQDVLLDAPYAEAIELANKLLAGDVGDFPTKFSDELLTMVEPIKTDEPARKGWADREDMPDD